MNGAAVGAAGAAAAIANAIKASGILIIVDHEAVCRIAGRVHQRAEPGGQGLDVYGAGAGGVSGRLKREGLSAEATIDRILEVVDAFKGDAPQSDDMTRVVVRVRNVWEKIRS